ncbi:hypothetical protein PIIN_03189 [Serendipita indica DSM 11827]|uniref:Uncharacterized protein n=1 Tax=Serendipita indica (strain DSM 11827) TaxID=1109443 RepID=G4TD76_SERID|nr:hypothetical protein PIIN_03189 [Serendipita indica DSM 11827]
MCHEKVPNPKRVDRDNSSELFGKAHPESQVCPYEYQLLYWTPVGDVFARYFRGKSGPQKEEQLTSYFVGYVGEVQPEGLRQKSA